MISIPLLLSVLAALPAAAQTSVGFAEPQDVSALLDYRLPEWSYRTWDASFQMNGRGSDGRNAGIAEVSNAFTSALGSAYFQAWESEERDLSVSGRADGNYSRSHDGRFEFEQRSRNFSGGLQGAVDWKRYLGGGPFAITASAGGRRSYRENSRFTRFIDQIDDDTYYLRNSTLDVAAGLGWGRVRNVVPLLRAQRLSERLTALGRPALTPGQIQRVAQVLAQEGGYRAVFDRADRRFWDDVLAPMLDAGQPLSVFEVFYLTDVMREQIGDRYEGFELRAELSFVESAYDYGYKEENERRRGPQLRALWYHHLSLHHQLQASARFGYQWQAKGSIVRDSGRLDLAVGHLWNLADRYRLESTAALGGFSVIQEESRNRRFDLSSTLNVYLEDRVSLITGVTAGYTWGSSQTEESLRWEWTYHLGLSYHLDRLFSGHPIREI